MYSNKRHLHVIPNTTCFSEHQKHNVDCKRKTCSNWIKHQKSHNCVLIASQDGNRTLESIGEIFDLTRMRICQIIKENKIKILKEIN